MELEVIDICHTNNYILPSAPLKPQQRENITIYFITLQIHQFQDFHQLQSYGLLLLNIKH